MTFILLFVFDNVDSNIIQIIRFYYLDCFKVQLKRRIQFSFDCTLWNWKGYNWWSYCFLCNASENIQKWSSNISTFLSYSKLIDWLLVVPHLAENSPFIIRTGTSSTKLNKTNITIREELGNRENVFWRHRKGLEDQVETK